MSINYQLTCLKRVKLLYTHTVIFCPKNFLFPNLSLWFNIHPISSKMLYGWEIYFHVWYEEKLKGTKWIQFKLNFFFHSKQLRQVAKMPTGSYLQPKNPECKVCISLSLLWFWGKSCMLGKNYESKRSSQYNDLLNI